MKLIVLLALICLSTAQKITADKICTCSQLKISSDCTVFPGCEWDQTLLQCKTATQAVTPTTNTPPQTSKYMWCVLGNQQDCSLRPGCAYVGHQCVPFPGCSSFSFGSSEACQAISNNCLSDGKTCINRLKECKQYQNQTACVKNSLPDSSNNFCYWNKAIGKCEEADTCVKLPQILKSDKSCRQYLNYCTVNGQSAGCVASGLNCKDQVVESQCVWNHSMTIKCFWKESSCFDLTCENAPTTYKLVDCENHFQGCIPRKDGGCRQRGSCDIVDVAEACTVNSTGGKCHWHENKCQDYTCAKASTLLQNHDQCVQYKDTCTVNSTKNGCEESTCENASASFTTTKQCRNHLSTCIAKSSGGCKQQSGCPKIELKEDCTLDYLNKKCFWNETAAPKCNYLQCNLAPGPVFTESHCNNFFAECTVKSDNSGCVEKTCPNLIDAACAIDKDGKKCQWMSQCMQKECSTGSQSLTTHAQCQTWSQHCTVASSLTGCTNLTTQCISYTNSQQCQFLKDGTICVWDNTSSSCFKKSCSTAFPISSYTSTSLCNAYISGCVVANSGQGCINKLTLCTDSLLQDNCPSPCVWNAITKCQVKQCNNADSSKTTTTLCDGWISGCIVNGTNNGCIDKPTNCNGQTQQQCNIKSKSTGDCYYNGSTCVDLTCDNIATTVTTHSGCQTILNTCTLKANQQGCMTIPSTCTGLIQQQCYLKQGGSCFWSGGACRDLQCSDAAKTTNFDTHDECAAFDKTCTVTAAFPQGCQDKVYPLPTTYANCIDAPQSDCSKSTNQLDCIWDTTSSKCVEKTCAMKTSLPYSKQDCFDWSSSCIFDSNPPCELYKVIGMSQAHIMSYSKNCLIEDISKCSNNMSCSYNSITNRCQSLINKCETIATENCVINSCTISGTNCITLDSAKVYDCREYLTQSRCGNPTMNYQYCEWNGTQCNFKTNCQTMSSTTCETSSYACTSSASGCVLKSANCSDYQSQEYCSATSTHQICRWNGTSCENLNCSQADNTSQTTCNSYHPLCFLLSKSLEKCSKRDSTCANILQQDQCQQPTNKGLNLCIWQSGACKNRDCNTYTGTFNHTNCEGHNYKCTVDDTASSCMDKKGCSGYTLQDQCHSSNLDVSCYWTGSACVDRTCAHAPSTSSYDDDTKCKTWMPTCGVVSPNQGCVVRQAKCSSITSQTQCFRNLADAKCYWNASTSVCVDDICTNYPATTNFDSHAKCQAVNSNCTVKATGETLVQGCVDLSISCTNYTAQDQCNITTSNVSCIWNASISPKCQVKSCVTAPHTSSYDDHTKCSAYHLDSNGNQICTAGATGGCIQRTSCTNYTALKSCVVDQSGTICGWNGTTCANKSCTTADNTNNDHTKCQAYFKICTDVTDPTCTVFTRPCTVNTTGNGCVTIAANCGLMTKDQCYKDINGNQCSWDTTKAACVLISCQLAPSTANSTALCQSYSPECVYERSCSYRKCEYYKLQDDISCETQQKGCTSNGVVCIERQLCSDAQNVQACTTDKDGNKCQWSISNNKCELWKKKCETAPVTLTLEKDCSEYLKECTPKLGGGCKTKSSCHSIEVKDSCNSDINGVQCHWTGNICRYKECKDYEGADSKQCQIAGLNCISNGQGTCMNSMKCKEIENYNNCYYGSDGPCLWIVTTKSLGKCYQFSECSSIQFTTHEECQQVSKYCTTDTKSCVNIQKCELNNIEGGCVVGSDGDCYLDQVKPQTCKLFTTCEEIKYLTHLECQQASRQCTSDGNNGCMPLLDCSDYNKIENCQFSKLGQIKSNSGSVISTGKCKWNGNQCKAEVCSDLVGLSHRECQAQLDNCTTNGATCITIQLCQLYTERECNIAISLNGQCFWDVDQCRIKTCIDNSIQATHKICSQYQNCRLEGDKCAIMLECAMYTDSARCYLKALDGQCTWNEKLKQCSLMKSCQSANQDQIGCLNNKTKCQWVAGTEQNPSTCQSHTCESNSFGSECRTIQTWDNQYIICELRNDKCQAVEPSELDQSKCLILSLGSYYWDTETEKCAVCSQGNKDNLINITSKSEFLYAVACLYVLIII